MVIWLGREWLERRGDPGEALDTCFVTTRERGSICCALTVSGGWTICAPSSIWRRPPGYRNLVPPGMADTLCQQLLIAVDRDILRSRTAQEERDSYRVDPKMEEVLRYIRRPSGRGADGGSSGKRFFHQPVLSDAPVQGGHRLHGPPVHQPEAAGVGRGADPGGVPVMKAAEQAGFEEYSTFLRAFRGTFHMSPREFR